MLQTLVDSHGNVDEETLEAYLKELEIAQQLRHPSVALVLAACMEPPDLCVIMEYAEHGGLDTVLYDHATVISPTIMYRMIVSVAKGCA